MEERFWSKVDKKEDNECWEWLKGKNNKGYGCFRINNNMYKAHRIAYEFYYKTKIEEGLLVRHKCDNPSCCNPYHFELGTYQDNMNDMVERNRSIKGENINTCKLTETQVLEIKEKLKNWKWGDDSRLAKEYNICPSNICAIRNNKTWKHIV